MEFRYRGECPPPENTAAIIYEALAKIGAYYSDVGDKATSFTPRSTLDSIRLRAIRTFDDGHLNYLALLEKAYLDVQHQRMGGRLGLEVFDYCWKRSKENTFGHLWYHGSPISMEALHNNRLERRMPMRRNPRLNGVLFNHGKPGVCVSNDYEEPVLLALFQRNAPHFLYADHSKELACTVMRFTTPGLASMYPKSHTYWGDRVAHHITTKRVLEYMQERDAQGYVYPIFGNGQPEAIRSKEYRFYHDIVPPVSPVRVTCDDLPGDLIVVDGDWDDVERFKLVWHQQGGLLEALKEVNGMLRVDTSQGYWPEELYQPPDRIY